MKESFAASVVIASVALGAVLFVGQVVSGTCLPLMLVWHGCNGAQILDDGTTYDGAWQWNAHSGQRHLRMGDGTADAGDFENDRISGFGTLPDADVRPVSRPWRVKAKGRVELNE